MLDEVGYWLERRSWSATDRPLTTLLDAKRAGGEGSSVSVVLPALNEERTVGEIVSVIRRELMTEAVPLVDELVVLDSGSTDRTAAVAGDAGAKVVHRDEVLPRLPALPGKGEVLWRSLLATNGEIVCFVDADLRDFSARFVSGVVGPLLTEPDVRLVKAMYDRPLGPVPYEPAALGGGGAAADPGNGALAGGGPGGGRVTELVARPLLNLHWPLLAGFVQPLGGEYAARRELLERLPFPVGYGVELGLLIDALHAAGLDALAQVDVGVRRHRHQDGQALGRMAAAIYRTAQLRLARGPGPQAGHGVQRGQAARGPLVRPRLTQFERAPSGRFVARTHAVDTEERPPMRDVPEYAARRRAA
ncbi:glucosyl-3-phosphoglycerate synthase [Streptomyces armeniacus]|uniref:Glucosyl-3-phosphoglycerate synthase n=1 Tax=Streptomyces armeniacus TaxID=83291 RepID=A0A345XYU1_9ACTN|nr:glucosyl-3-phosphoglycerate synthase [Streptomyces armeniacus]AXK36807.1 glucosyl-3-phosphoglycerate synthase [Streptomyces armeniacus]